VNEEDKEIVKIYDIKKFPSLIGFKFDEEKNNY